MKGMIETAGSGRLIELPGAQHYRQVGGKGVRVVPLVELMRSFGYLPVIAGGALLVPNQAEVIMLKAFLNHTAPQDLDIKLYTNNKTPDEADTEADYTSMGAVQSYALVSLAASGWTVTPGAPTSAAYPQITWTFSSGGPTNVYGYFVVQRSSGKLMWAERFTGAPFVVQNSGDTIEVTPAITLE